MNRLASERSPYLLQHATNPVAWFAWGEAAFQKARSESKPIFLSVGYSTCHWCHVMEHESFENAEVASLLNAHFVSVKVDREERPDVDRVYMAFVQATTGSGGWPMSVWLTPSLQPFFGGTYFPAESKWGRPGFADLLREIARVWQSDTTSVLESAGEMTARLVDREHQAPGRSVPDVSALDRATAQFRSIYDARRGGFGGAPKFPRPSELLFLLREHVRTGAPDLRDMVFGTLRAMAHGGMRDHVGGGFHRYSVDAEWRVPHFEKMLYDQAQLTLAYLEAAQLSGDAFYLDVAQDTLRYVMREMSDPDGGFYSAEDADSLPPEHAGDSGARPAEGAFYLWRAEDIDQTCGDVAPLLRRAYGVEVPGNAPVDPHQEFVGKNILYLPKALDDLAAEAGLSVENVRSAIGRGRMALFSARLARPRPLLDDKVLTSWNGLMIAAFARAARVVRGAGDDDSADRFLQTARSAAMFLRDRAWREDSRTLLRRYRQGHAEIEGYAEDYASLIFGLLELLQTDPDPKWLVWAETLQRRQDELFWDAEGGGWYSTVSSAPDVLLRMKETYDGAEPSASAVSAFNLLTLSGLVADGSWSQRLEDAFRAFAPQLETMGRAVPMMVAALSTYHAGRIQIVVVKGGRGPLERAVLERYLPQATVLVMTPDQQAALSSALPLVAGMMPVDGAATAYVCQHFACQPPTTSRVELMGLLPPTR